MPPKQAPPKSSAIVAEDQAKQFVAAYLQADLVQDFSSIPEHQKLAVCQRIPEQFIEQRVIAKKQGQDITAPYIPHTVAEKLLNFVFNFNVSCELLEGQWKETKEQYRNYQHPNAKRDARGFTIPVVEERPLLIAIATVRFTFTKQDGTKIIRDVVSGHRYYNSPATTRADAMQSAISKAWTRCAKTFGIGADLTKKEEEAYQKADAIEVQEAPAVDLPY